MKQADKHFTACMKIREKVLKDSLMESKDSGIEEKKKERDLADCLCVLAQIKVSLGVFKEAENLITRCCQLYQLTSNTESPINSSLTFASSSPSLRFLAQAQPSNRKMSSSDSVTQLKLSSKLVDAYTTRSSISYVIIFKFRV